MALKLSGRTGEPQAAEPVKAFVPGPQNAEERHTMAFLAAITQDALPDYEWYRFGPGWKPYYYLVSRTGDTPQEQAFNGLMPPELFEKLKRGFEMPTVTDGKTILAQGPSTLTMFFANAANSKNIEAGFNQACIDPGYPFPLDGHTRFLPQGQHLELGDETFAVNTGNLVYLAQNWEALKAAVERELSAPAQAVSAPAPALTLAAPAAA